MLASRLFLILAAAAAFLIAADTEGRIQRVADTLFQAASISKHVAAMVALHLVDEGKLALDEDGNLKLRS